MAANRPFAMTRKKRSRDQKWLDITATAGNRISVTKLDVVSRQIETAIKLWFDDADPVSIHTLAMAAHAILRVINKSRNGLPMFGDPSPSIRKEYSELVRKLYNQSSNFFKHSSSDADESHFFLPI